MHVHKHYHNLLFFSLGIILLGGSFGAAGGIMGQSIFTISDASSQEDYQMMDEEKQILRAAERRKLFQQKLQERLSKRQRITAPPDIYPLQSNLLHRQPAAQKLDVTIAFAEISIPSLHIAAPVNRPSRTYWDQGNWKMLEEQMQFGHNNGVSLYPNSPQKLWEDGNYVITGHSSPPTFDAKQSPYGDVFSRLPEVRKGDIVEIEDHLGNRFTYEITETMVVHPSETSILKQGTERELTLMTCYPVGTTRSRFIARGKPVEEVSGVAMGNSKF